jgi:hypothetical protein
MNTHTSSDFQWLQLEYKFVILRTAWTTQRREQQQGAVVDYVVWISLLLLESQRLLRLWWLQMELAQEWLQLERKAVRSVQMNEPVACCRHQDLSGFVMIWHPSFQQYECIGSSLAALSSHQMDWYAFAHFVSQEAFVEVDRLDVTSMMYSIDDLHSDYLLVVALAVVTLVEGAVTVVVVAVVAVVADKAVVVVAAAGGGGVEAAGGVVAGAEAAGGVVAGAEAAAAVVVAVADVLVREVVV